MSTPTLRDGDTIMVRAEVKRIGDLQYAVILDGADAVAVEALNRGWEPDYLTLRVGDPVNIIGKPSHHGEVVAVSPPGVNPQQFWVKDASEWCLRTYMRDQLVRILPDSKPLPRMQEQQPRGPKP